MARRDLLTGDERRALFGVPLDRASLGKFYTVLPEYRVLIETRCQRRYKMGPATGLKVGQSV